MSITRGQRRKTYRIKFTDHHGRVRYMQGFDRLRDTHTLTDNLHRIVRAHRSGGVIPADLYYWLRFKLDKSRLQHLIDWGMVSAHELESGKTLKQHLDDWRSAMLSKGVLPKSAEQSHRLAALVLDGVMDYEQIARNGFWLRSICLRVSGSGRPAPGGPHWWRLNRSAPGWCDSVVPPDPPWRCWKLSRSGKLTTCVSVGHFPRPNKPGSWPVVLEHGKTAGHGSA
ncbi:MAG: hypothetical protein HC898_09390, partial [Phycisphaerales bacterium]|nr:hypothetical protein [Phycisphaerales bacterium]